MDNQMDEAQVISIVQDQLQTYSVKNMFGISNIPTHKHNNVDSPALPFLGLTDVPVSYHGQAGNVVTVNATESGLEFDASGVGTGTVTSVTVTGANGIGVSGSPITTSGTVALSLGNITPSTIKAVVTISTVVSMSTVAVNGSNGNVFTRTLATNETFTQSGFTVGQCFMVEVTQGSGTSYTVTWFSGITWVTSGATPPTQTTTSSGITVYGFRCTGSNTFLGYYMATQ